MGPERTRILARMPLDSSEKFSLGQLNQLDQLEMQAASELWNMARRRAAAARTRLEGVSRNPGAFQTAYFSTIQSGMTSLRPVSTLTMV